MLAGENEIPAYIFMLKMFFGPVRQTKQESHGIATKCMKCQISDDTFTFKGVLIPINSVRNYNFALIVSRPMSKKLYVEGRSREGLLTNHS